MGIVVLMADSCEHALKNLRATADLKRTTQSQMKVRFKIITFSGGYITPMSGLFKRSLNLLYINF